MFNNLEVKLISGVMDVSKPIRIQISMFSSYCTGIFLFALSSWVRSQGYESIEFQVSDTLQRYNFAWRDRLDPDESLARASYKGEKWLLHNAPILQLCFQMFDKVSISRWDFWINHKEFKMKNSFFTHLYHNDSGFRDSINREIENYFEKAGRTLTDERRCLSAEFLIEEIAVSEISAEHFPANEIYPGPRFGPEQYLVESSIEGIKMKDMTFIHVDFSKKGGL